MRVVLRGVAAALLLVLVVPQAGSAAVTHRVEVAMDGPVGPFPAVRTSLVTLTAPMPAGVQGAPAACDELAYYRYRSTSGPDDPQQADAVFVSMPGLLGGASSLELNAAQVVQRAADAGHAVEYWALDRRSNCMEDHSGIEAGLRAGNPGVALDYYHHGLEVDGRTFGGYGTQSRLKWLGSVGLEQTLQDYRDVITSGIPDPEVRRTKVYCGGHSLGGLLGGLLMAWDFDGDTRTRADAGYNLCAGGVALDTLFSADPDALYAQPSLAAMMRAATQPLFGLANGLLARGKVPYDIDIGVIGPPGLIGMSEFGLIAHQRPHDDISPLLTRLPGAKSGIDLALRFLGSQNTRDAMAPVARLRRMHLTGWALLGALQDDNSQQTGVLKASIGSYDRGPVQRKTFPWAAKQGGWFGDVWTGTQQVMVPSDPGVLYDWRAFDEPQADLLTPSGQPYSSPEEEVTDIRDLARLLIAQPLDMIEAYFPLRLLSDTTYAVAGARNGDLSHLKYLDAPTQVPRVTLFSHLGNALRHAGIRDVPKDAIDLPGYDHIDVVTASPRQSSGAPERSSSAVADFLTAPHSGTRATPSVVTGAASPEVVRRRIREAERLPGAA